MSIRKLVFLLGSLVAVYAPGALADCSGVMCESIYIQALNAESGSLQNSDDIWVQTSGTETALNCTANSGAWLKLSSDSPMKKEVYALLLTAFTTDRLISIRVVDNSTDCVIAYAYMTR